MHFYILATPIIGGFFTQDHIDTHRGESAEIDALHAKAVKCRIVATIAATVAASILFTPAIGIPLGIILLGIQGGQLNALSERSYSCPGAFDELKRK